MLFPHQIIPFLQHDSRRVRDHAARYLSQINDPSPATADDIWSAIDRHGWDHAAELLKPLSRLPAGDAAVARLLKEAGAAKNSELRAHLSKAVQGLPLAALLRCREEVLASADVSDETRTHLQTRIALHDASSDAIWDQLMEFARQVGDKRFGEIDMSVADRLIEAAGRHPQLGERALAVLSDPSIEDWREIFAVQVLGSTVHAPGVEKLLEKLTDSEDTYVNERAAEALAAIGGEEIVRRVEQAHLQADEDSRFMIHLPLSRIALQSAEDALLRMFESEESIELQTLLMDVLCQIVSARAFPLISGRVLAGEYDGSLIDMESQLLVLSLMTAQELPERERLSKQLDERDRRMALRMQQMEAWMSKRQEDPPARDATPRPENYDPIAPPVTIRRESPKVGRNDPCPCGSGQKYKKCCMGKAKEHSA